MTGGASILKDALPASKPRDGPWVRRAVKDTPPPRPTVRAERSAPVAAGGFLPRAEPGGGGGGGPPPPPPGFRPGGAPAPVAGRRRRPQLGGRRPLLWRPGA